MKKTSLLIAMVLLSILSCKKPEKKEDPKPDGEQLENLFKEQRENDVQTFQIDASQGDTVNCAQGTEIIFPPNAFLLNGSPVTGNVDIKVIEIYNRAGMVLKNMPTTGVRPNGDEETLISGGELFIEALQNGNKLSAAQDFTVNSAIDPQGDFNNPMQIFKAGDEMDDTDKWEEVDENQDGHQDMAQFRDGIGAGNLIYYTFDTSSFGWTNLDRWSSYNGPLTTLNVAVPDGYDGSNCELFVIYDGEPKALARLDTYDPNTGMFSEHFGKLPVGIDIHILMVATIDDVLHYSLVGTTSVANTTTETMPAPQPTTEQDLIAIINGLP